MLRRSPPKLTHVIAACTVGPVAQKALHRDWYTVAEVAAMFRLSKKTIERACRRGEILAELVHHRWCIPQATLLAAVMHSPALRPDLQLTTSRGEPRKRRPFIRSSRAKKPRAKAA